ncbi:hypothetical protein [Labrenzia sp. 011]|uniref:hypothetical protein n=1 Tax=Labrenzia sp. 011 TaxID=2171494 RepID=UPI000D50861A|nr:hypothetical protein [Labrenzia sp. 011]PVB59776.1 hypothetical protein DCO57_20465 [Labrenzia sp. 011]
MQKTHGKTMRAVAGASTTRGMMAAGLVIFWTIAAGAQSNQLRVLPQSGSPRLPSAEQQLNQNMNRQESDFSTRQRMDSTNRLNRTEDINRQNTRPDINSAPCPGANATCRDNQ